ncbi:MAG: hypothetical protein WCT23_05455 [Candidatus Neomarinimicrobiota bacterium]
MNISQETRILVINGNTLRTAHEYILHPYSSSVNDHYKKMRSKLLNSPVLKH